MESASGVEHLQMMFVSLLLFSQLIFAVPADDEHERFFHDIYTQFNQEPTSDSIWAKAVNSASKKEYQVVSGDTLWEISQTFFADPFFWPKLWAINVNQIGSPHEISVGQNIVFIAGTVTSPPIIQLSGKANLTKEDRPIEIQGAMPQLDYQIPAPYYKSKPLSDIPSSLPEWKFPSEKQQDQFELSGKIREDKSAESVLPIIATDEFGEGVGSVIGIDHGGSAATMGQGIIVQFRMEPTEKKYQVVSPGKLISDPYLYRKGWLVEPQGEIELAEVLNRKERIYRATVSESIAALQKGAHILPTSIFKVPALNPNGPSGEAKAFILTGTFSIDRAFFDGTSPILLNRGSDDGVNVDQVLGIYRNHVLTDPHLRIRENPKKIGTLQIVQTSKKFSVAVILNIEDAIRRGDVTSAELAVDETQIIHK